MNLRIIPFAIAALVMSSFSVAQPPDMPKPQKEHEWLKNFVGEWDSEAEAIMQLNPSRTGSRIERCNKWEVAVRK